MGAHLTANVTRCDRALSPPRRAASLPLWVGGDQLTPTRHRFIHVPSTPVPPKTRSGLRRLVLVAVVALLVTTPASADESISDIRADREAARDAEAAALAELEFLELEDQRIAEILAEIQLAVDAQVARVEGGRQALDAAQAEVITRQTLADTASADVARTITEIRQRAVDAYVGTDTTAEPWLQSGDINKTAVRLAMLDFAAGSDRDLLDHLRRLQVEREDHVIAGEEARIEADQLRAQLEEELDELQTRQLVQAEIQNELQSRIDAWEAEADALARASVELTAFINAKVRSELGVSPGEAGAESIEGFTMPTSGSVGSGFGTRVHPIFGTVRQHTGIDIGGSTGDPIWASKEGRVIFAGWKGGYGNTVIVAHTGNVATLYAHMSETLARAGDEIDGGEIIGLVGSTGWSTGPHLHFETRLDGVPKDPLFFLPL